MRRVVRFFRLPFAEQRLLLEAACLTSLASLALLVLPFRWVARQLGTQMQETPTAPSEADEATLQRIRKAILIATRNLPWKSRCFAQAIAGSMMLRLRHMSGTLYLGVARDDVRDVAAHAWLRSGCTLVTGGEEAARHSVVATFAFSRGRQARNASE